MALGVRRNSQNGRGNNYGAEDTLSNGSMIYVLENMVASPLKEEFDAKKRQTLGL